MQISENEKIKNYIDDICSVIKNRSVHKEVREELLSHFEESVKENLSVCDTEDQAVSKAINDMGDSIAIGRQLNKIHKLKPEWRILIITLLFMLFGLFAMYFINMYGAVLDDNRIFLKSLVYTLIGIAIVCLLYYTDYRKMRYYSKYIYFATLLVLVYVMVFGSEIGGRRAGLNFGFINIDFVKICPYFFTIALAGILDGWDWSSTKKVILGIVICMAPAILICAVPSTSAFIMYMVISLVLLKLSGIRLKGIAQILGVILVIITCTLLTEPFRFERYFAFLNYNQDPNGSGWLNYRLYELVSSAGLLGKGFNLDYKTIPNIHNSFIFTYIVYTFGWIVGTVFATFVIAFLVRMYKVGTEVNNGYGKLLVSGFATIYTFQFLWNILMNLNLVPLFDFNLPFITYGSQFIMNMIAIGLIMNIYKLRNAKEVAG